MNKINAEEKLLKIYSKMISNNFYKNTMFNNL